CDPERAERPDRSAPARTLTGGVLRPRLSGCQKETRLAPSAARGLPCPGGVRAGSSECSEGRDPSCSTPRTGVPSTGKALGERERRGLSDLREATWVHIGQERALEDLIGFVPFLGTQGVFVCRSRHDGADDQAVRPEAIDDLVQRTFEVE